MTRKLLIITQKVDKNDPVLGFFHRWIEKLAAKTDIIVICLEKGVYNLPMNVEVLSLGKEKGIGRLGYIKNLWEYAWKKRREYKKVFVHMNEEYVLLLGLWWRFTEKKIYMWRNHAKGSISTLVAIFLSNKVYATSPDAFTARYSKTKLMPVGVEAIPVEIKREKDYLMLGRISPVKNVDRLIEAITDSDLKVDIVGSPSIKQDEKYYEEIEEKIDCNNLREQVHLLPAVKYQDTPIVFCNHKYFINLTLRGSLDKTIFEAISYGLVPIVANTFFSRFLPKELVVDPTDLKSLRQGLLAAKELYKDEKMKTKLKKLASDNNLDCLIEELMKDLSV